jgi:hypothetical protein
MAEQQGGRWDVGVKDDAVFIARISDDDERVFEDLVAPEEARQLAELLRKYAGKADEADAGDKKDKKKDDDEDKDKDDDDKDEKDDDDDRDEKDDDDDKDEKDDDDSSD